MFESGTIKAYAAHTVRGTQMTDLTSCEDAEARENSAATERPERIRASGESQDQRWSRFLHEATGISITHASMISAWSNTVQHAKYVAGSFRPRGKANSVRC